MSLDLSVIMPSFLGRYEGAASDREDKLRRAVQSFIDSEGEYDAELVLVGDGCESTKAFWSRLATEHGADPFWRQLETAPGRSIQYIELPKQPQFSGAVRNAGLLAAKAPVIAYLDTDDRVLPDHFSRVLAGFDADVDWVLFDDLVWPDKWRQTRLEYGACGTSTVAHRAELGATWPSGYGHDYEFILTMSMLSPRWTHIGRAGYVVCHIPREVDV